MDWSEIMQHYQRGQLVTSCIERIDHAGIFTSIDGVVKGYTKRAEAALSRRVIDLSQLFSVGQMVPAKVLGFNDRHATIDLSFRQAEQDPWPDFVEKIKEGMMVEGTVVLLTESKAIVEILPGIAGIIHQSEMWLQADCVEHVFMVDDRVRLQVAQIDHDNRMLVLSAKGLFQDEKDSETRRATFRIEEKLNDALQVYRWQQSKQTRRKYTLSPAFHKRFNKIYIFAAEPNFAEVMATVLESHGVACELFTRPNEAANLEIDAALAVVAAGNFVDELLPLWVDRYYPALPMLIYGAAEELAFRRGAFSRLSKNVNYIQVPHAAQELIKTINIIAGGEFVDGNQVVLAMNNNQPQREVFPPEKNDLQSVLNDIQKVTRASFVVVFCINYNSMETDVFATAGKSFELDYFDRGHLQFTPISDVIIDGDFVREERGCQKFKYMKPLGRFESLVGIKINYSDENGYGLFLFGEKMAAFARLDDNMFGFAELAVRAQIERQKLLARTSEEQKFVLSGKLTTNFMHEMKNQVQAMEYWLEILKTDSINLNNGGIKSQDLLFLARFEQAIDGAFKSQKRARNIEELFLNLLRKDEKKAVRLDKYVQEFLDSLKPIATHHKIKLEMTCPHSVEIKVCLSSFNQILLNLILNSLEFIPLVRRQSGLVQINIYKETKDKLPVKIEVSDNGPGVNERNRERIFDLLFTTKKNGSGLGLPISRRLTRELGGRLTVKDTVRLGGTTFLLELPLE